MYKLLLSEIAVKDLKSFPADERVFIAEKLNYLAKNFDQLVKTKKVKRLKGTRFYRFVIARKIRAIFDVNEGTLTILILRVGRRRNIYSDFFR
ncbi:type II toxin-antitoxin system RelE family toxin [Desulfurobacterium sp.]